MFENFKKRSSMKKQLLVLSIMIYSNIALAQYYPVNLNIENLPQENTAWCWAATAQQVIKWINGTSPDQCELVASAYRRDVGKCCESPETCDLAGNLQQIQFLIRKYGGHHSSIAPPADALILYNTLTSGKAIILFLQTTPYIGHYVVLTGMEFIQTPYGPNAVMYINDPMAYYTQPVPFNNLLMLWRAAIVVY
jgi:hypothetical protein